MALSKKAAWTRILIWALLVAGGISYCIVWMFHEYQRYGEQLSVFGDIAIGDSRGEIRYKLGTPPVVYGDPQPGAAAPSILYTDPLKDPALPAGADINSYRTWSYNSGTGLDPHINLTFDARSGRVSKIDCIDQSDPPVLYCARIAGAGVGDPESRITALFGKPSRQSIDDRSGVKTMAYDDLGVVFLLARQRVYAISVMGAGAQRPIRLDRFLIWVASDLRSVFGL